MLPNVHGNKKLIRDGEKGSEGGVGGGGVGGGGGGGGEGEVNSWSARSDGKDRRDRHLSTARTTLLRRWGSRQCEAACVLR